MFNSTGKIENKEKWGPEKKKGRRRKEERKLPMWFSSSWKRERKLCKVKLEGWFSGKILKSYTNLTGSNFLLSF